MDKKFCHHCGNDTLRKLSVSINEDGTMKYYLSKRRPKLYKKVRFCYNFIIRVDYTFICCFELLIVIQMIRVNAKKQMIK